MVRTLPASVQYTQFLATLPRCYRQSLFEILSIQVMRTGAGHQNPAGIYFGQCAPIYINISLLAFLHLRTALDKGRRVKYHHIPGFMAFL